MHFWRNHLNITICLRQPSRLITINCFWLGTIAFPFPTYWFAALPSRDHRGELSFYLLSIAAVGLVGRTSRPSTLQRHPELFEIAGSERAATSARCAVPWSASSWWRH